MNRFNGDVLENIQGDYNIDVQKLKTIYSFVGAEIKSFIDKISKVIPFLKVNCVSTEFMDDFVEGLSICTQLFILIKITKSWKMLYQ